MVLYKDSRILDVTPGVALLLFALFYITVLWEYTHLSPASNGKMEIPSFSETKVFPAAVAQAKNNYLPTERGPDYY